MKNIKNILKKNCLLQVVTLFVLVFAANSFSMRMPSEQRKVAVKKAMRQTKSKNHYFIHETNNPENGIWVDKDFVKANCKSIKLMIEDLGSELTAIPLDCSVATIKLVFDVLGNKIDVIDLGLQELIDVTNVFNYLDVPAGKMNVVVARIKKDVIDASSTSIATTQLLKKLNPDIQKLLLTDSAIDYLKDFIVKKYVNDRKKILINYPCTISALAISADGTKMISGEEGYESYSAKNLILWDISNPDNITYQKLVGHEGPIRDAAISSDGTKVVATSNAMQNNFILWDISNPYHIIPKVLEGHINIPKFVAFTHDGKKIISTSFRQQDNLILWDISDPNNVTHQVLVGLPIYAYANAIAISPDDTKIVAACPGYQTNLILWNISDFNNVTHQALVGHAMDVDAVAFSSDSTKIVSGGYEQLIVWDISDSQHIEHQPLIGHLHEVGSVALSSDSKNIVSSSKWEKNPILWNISNFNNITHQSLVGHSNGVWSVAFSCNGKRIVSGGLCGGYLTGNNLILWDVSDRNNITHQSLKGHTFNVHKVLFSPDGKKMVSGGDGRYANLILWTLLTDQEEILLNQLKNYNANQVRLIYQLCLQSLKGQSIALKEGSEERAIFMTLPEDMQKLLVDLFFSKGWFGW